MNGYQFNIPLIAGADLRASQYKAVVVAGTIAADNTAIGLQQNKPNTGENLSACIGGRSLYVAGGAVAAGADARRDRGKDRHL